MSRQASHTEKAKTSHKGPRRDKGPRHVQIEDLILRKCIKRSTFSDLLLWPFESV